MRCVERLLSDALCTTTVERGERQLSVDSSSFQARSAVSAPHRPAPALQGLAPAALMTRLNLQIARHAPRSRFITLFFAVFEPADGTLTWVNAGHLPPIIRRRDGTLGHLAHGGLALGLAEASTYDAETTQLEPGDLLLLYSDGITEAESPSGVPFDEEGLLGIVAASPDATAPDLAGRVMAAVSKHARDERFADDLTVLILRRLPPLPRVAA